MSEALTLARSLYREIPLYAPDRTPCATDLSDNTNRFGVPPAALRALRGAEEEAVARYPRPFADALKAALAGYAGVEPGEIATGCGSDDVIDSAIRAFSEPGDALAYPDPTFAMVPIFARMNGLDPVPVPLAADLDIDPDALLATGARILYLCSPNNPTGRAASRHAVERVVRESSGLVILDEAYAEYAGANWIAAAPERERLIVTRTLSKAFGLAGLRIGYAAGAAPLVRELEKSRGPFKVGTLAERAAVAALTEDLGWVGARVDEARAIRARFAAALAGRGIRALPSDANFVLVPVPDAARVAAAMRAGGVAVRPFPGLARIGDAVRITVGPWPLMERALARLTEALA
ncbi:MAG TPA: histidinol-phosphate transaminase [Candidatus Eisenbacteria bacterium]|jgi:histidinol-phosphate aminotransferase